MGRQEVRVSYGQLAGARVVDRDVVGTELVIDQVFESVAAFWRGG